PLRMSADQARAVHQWIARGSCDPEAEPRRIEGMWVQPSGRPDEYELAWQPVIVLSERSRQLHGARSAAEWTPRIASDLVTCLVADDDQERIDTEEELAAERKRIWDALLPSHYASVLREVPPAAAPRVFDLLQRERVRKNQMEIVRNNKRMYPVQGGACDQ